MSFLFPRFNNCCACFDLRVGSLIILWLSVIFWTFFAIKAPSTLYGLLIVLFAIIPAAVGVHGAHKNEPDYLVPWIVASIIHIILMLFFAVYIIVWRIVEPKKADDSVTPEKNDNSTRKLPHSSNNSSVNLISTASTGAGVSTIFLFFILVTGALTLWYFMNVVRSFYLQLREGSHEQHTSRSEVSPASPRQ